MIMHFYALFYLSNFVNENLFLFRFLVNFVGSRKKKWSNLVFHGNTAERERERVGIIIILCHVKGRTCFNILLSLVMHISLYLSLQEGSKSRVVTTSFMNIIEKRTFTLTVFTCVFHIMMRFQRASLVCNKQGKFFKNAMH